MVALTIASSPRAGEETNRAGGESKAGHAAILDYLAEASAQLAALAKDGGLPTLAYFLALARSEAQLSREVGSGASCCMPASRSRPS